MQTDARVGRMMEGVHGGGSGANRKYTTLLRSQQKQQSYGLQRQPQFDAIQHLLAGGIAGAVSKTCTAPLARLTILFQVKGMHSDVATLRKASIWREISRILYEEGFRAFWKGNLVTIVHRLPYSSISFYAYEHYKNMMQSIIASREHKEYISSDVLVKLVSGGLSGITAASITYPLDLVRTRLAAQTNIMYYRGIFDALSSICRDEGARGLYKGLGATLLGVGPSIAISFTVYETLRARWQIQRPYDSSVLISLACGSLSGIASSTMTFPLDLVRRRMQLEGAAGKARVYKSGLFGAFGHIIHSEGFRGLYRGILAEYFKVVPSVGIVFMTYETVKSLLSAGD
ncbi:hypothetical protein M5K25_001147 [Dendrobium thyrsiflorum]|uniref:Uncharacterized protein n=1 Tax=Dendrobium thyrsiflorum TaxID=117978 RepID=A0ABD0WG05_DENTH